MILGVVMETLLDRFCRYVQIDTQAREGAECYPSSPGQRELGKLLVQELLAFGLKDAAADDHGIVMATIPPTVQSPVPTVAFIAHLDTSPETSGRGVRPVLHRDYRGDDLILPGDSSQVLRTVDQPELARLVGGTLITSDGTTLLGADDKAGVAVIMETASMLMRHREIPHGPMRLCFTCDEEIGHGVDYVDLDKLGATVAYTLDGSGQGEIDVETFSADLAVVRIRGVNIHPAVAKGTMVNAVRVAAHFIARLPWQALSPEATQDRAGFLHPYRVSGGVGEATVHVLLRDFDTAKLGEKADLLRAIAGPLRAEHPRAEIQIGVTPQYRNMAEGLAKDPRAVLFAEEAVRRAGLEPKRTIVRGGTDGSRLTERGLPTPNLSTGEHNPHSPLEWTSLEEMSTAVKVLIHLVQVWAQAREAGG
jgi:tripeptide aminopeptidase